MHRLAFHITLAALVAMISVDLFRRHMPDPVRLFPPVTAPPRRVIVAVYYRASGDLLTFREPRRGRRPWSVVRLDAPADARLDVPGDLLRIGPDAWTATQCLLLALWDHPAGLRFAPRDDQEGPSTEAAPWNGMALPNRPEDGPGLVALYYDPGADRLTFRRPESAPPGGPAARIGAPEGGRLSAEDDLILIGPYDRTATEGLLRALRGEEPDLRLAPLEGQEAPRLAPGAAPASRRKGEAVVGGAGGASS